jgi:hypothetical protein
MSIYRKIYEQHYGLIPVDDDGRTYEIHHIDGNRANNDINNLVSVSIQEHYDIHYKQGDWAACLAISMRMNKSPEEISKIQSEIGRKSALERKAKGTNPFCYTGEKHHRYKVAHTEETREKIKTKRALQVMPSRPDIKKLFSKDWIVTFPNGSIEKVTNLKAFCEKHNLFYATMVKIGNKQIKSHRGFSCEKIEELRP